ncbi:MAG TPA: glutamate--tRNA ligase [Campylobacterales bacterium]|nr:glutamate--tRNA ligase [Campylobacterales bacterium]
MVITRFAPSPTGYLHIGGLRTALFSWLWARKNNGKFLLRIEDTDLSRNSEEALKAILEAFDWVGLNYDGEAEYQSKRFDIYKKYVQQLLDEGKAYHCYMSREELEALREAQQAAGEQPRYNGRYRDGVLPAVEGVEPVVRIKAPLSGAIEFDDGVKGKLSFGAKEIDDFIIARSDGTPTYNFVVVIDDALMGVTEVIRGDDHTSNTPKQIILYEALGFTIPKFYHVPMILGEGGKKLSKRDGAADVMEYKTLGYLPEALLNFLVRLGWSHGDQELFTMDEMLAFFDPSGINKSASQYNIEKLNWINGEQLKKTPISKLKELLADFGCTEFGANEELLFKNALERAKTLIELGATINTMTKAPTSYDEAAVAKNINDEAKTILRDFAEALKSTDASDEHGFKTVIDEFLAARGVKMPKLGMPIRIALTGSTQSPSINELIAIVGKEESIRRVESFLQ